MVAYCDLLVQGVAMSTTAVMPFRFLAETPIFSVFNGHRRPDPVVDAIGVEIDFKPD